MNLKFELAIRNFLQQSGYRIARCVGLKALIKEVSDVAVDCPWTCLMLISQYSLNC